MTKQYETTTDILNEALQLQEEAKQVRNERAHAKWWDKKVDLLHIINDLFETGAFTGEAYEELWSAKHTLYRAEAYAGKYAMEL
jgi:hypothetical protein